jgi:hypothetical protein
MASTEEAGGPTNLKTIFFILFNVNEQTSTLFLLKMQKKGKNQLTLLYTNGLS